MIVHYKYLTIRLQILIKELGGIIDESARFFYLPAEKIEEYSIGMIDQHPYVASILTEEYEIEGSHYGHFIVLWREKTCLN